MGMVSKLAKLLFYGLIVVAVPRCSHDSDPGLVTGPSVPPVVVTIKPVDPFRLDLIGETDSRSLLITPADVVVNFSSSNTAVATVSPSQATSNFSFDGNHVLVEAINFGTAKLQIQAQATTMDVPISVWPNGTWKGSVRWLGGCVGSDAAYEETAVIAVNDAGVGKLTVTDTNGGFVREYAITIPSSPAQLTFESAGVFVYRNGLAVISVPGRISVTLNHNQIDYREVTAWGECSNIYAGGLEKTDKLTTQ